MEDDERDLQLTQLREENERLRTEAAALRASEHRGGWRWALSVVLLVLGGVLLAAAVITGWAGRTLLNTNRYTETVAPLASNPTIQKSFAVNAVNRIFERVDVATTVQQALPPRASFVAPQITEGLRTFSVRVAERALATPQFQTLWTEANRRAHERIVGTLLTGTGPSGGVSAQSGNLTLNTTAIVGQVKQALIARGLGFVSRVPDTIAGGEVTLFQSAQLAQIQTYLRALQVLSIALPVLALLVLVGAIFAAPDRRKALMWVGVTAIVAMLALGVGLTLARNTYVASPPAGLLSGSAAVAFFDTLVRFLRNAMRTVAAVGLVILVAAALAGPSTFAVRMREAATSGTAALGLDLGRPAVWTDRHRRALDATLVVLAAVALLATNTPTPALVLGIALVVVLGLLLIELIARSHPQTPTGYRQEPTT